MVKIYIGADHGGFILKHRLTRYLLQLGYHPEDLGNVVLDAADDYPIFAARVARAVVKNKKSLGLLVCRNGVGVAIAANKVSGVRAVTANQVAIAVSSRHDDNTNILCLGQEYISLSRAKKIVYAWLNANFSSQRRYRRRLRQLIQLEKGRKL